MGTGGETVPILDPRNYFPFSAESDQAPLWAMWFTTHGAKGEPPPAEVLEAMELYRRIERTADAAEQVRLFHEILRLNERELWVIGTVCGTAPPFVVKSSPRRAMVNVPDHAAMDWQFRAPGNSAPECFAITGTQKD